MPLLDIILNEVQAKIYIKMNSANVLTLAKKYSVVKRQETNQFKITQYNSNQLTRYEFIKFDFDK
jgi:hypothetical protein